MPKYNLGKAVINKANIPTFTPKILFARGEQGAWYDPSDFSTLYQDTRGQSPVTALGQSVGLMQDKPGNGNDAAQATAGARPTVQARVNLLERTDALNNAYWTRTGMTVTENTTDTTDPLGGNTAAKAEVSANERQFSGPNQITIFPVGTTVTYSIYAKKGNAAVWPFRVGTTGASDSLSATVGESAGVEAHMKLHQMILLAANVSGNLLDQTERFVARKTGVTL